MYVLFKLRSCLSAVRLVVCIDRPGIDDTFLILLSTSS